MSGPLAAVWRRVCAFLVDAAVVSGAVALGTRLDPTSGGGRAFLRRLFAVATLYHVVLEGRSGRTVGKRALGIAVRRADGGPSGYRAAALRTAARPVDWLPVGYLLGFLAIGLTARRQRLGDLAADTVVVRAPSGAA